MSEEPEVREVSIAESVEEHLAEILGSQGAMFTGYLGVVTYLAENGDNVWTFLHSENSTATQDLGMARIITKTVERAVDYLMDAESEEDEED